MSLFDDIRDYRLKLNNAVDNPDILADMSELNWNEPKMKKGLERCDEADELIKKQLNEYGEQHAATAVYDTLRDSVNKIYIRTLKVARIVLEDNEKAQTALMLRGKRKRSQSGWLEQATTFYDNLFKNPEMLTKMEEYSYTKEKLETEQARISEVEAAAAKQKNETGDAQAATDKRDARMEELDKFMSEFVAFARIALDEDPQRLEKLGIIIK